MQISKKNYRFLSSKKRAEPAIFKPTENDGPDPQPGPSTMSKALAEFKN